jgi:hypothetical protein
MRASRQHRSADALSLLLAFVTTMASSMARPAAAKEGDLLGTDFEAFTGIPKASAHEIPDAELDTYRGMAGILFFQVALTGLVDLNGNVIANLNVNTGLGGESDTVSLPGTSSGQPVTLQGNGAGGATVTPAGGTPFLVQASIGSDAFQNSNGIFQISQIPGNNNSVITQLTVNVGFVQATPQVLNQIQNVIGTLRH